MKTSLTVMRLLKTDPIHLLPQWDLDFVQSLGKLFMEDHLLSFVEGLTIDITAEQAIRYGIATGWLTDGEKVADLSTERAKRSKVNTGITRTFTKSNVVSN
jgi:hypothetical protein